MKTIYLAGGCFWGVQKFFDQFDGIEETVVGYANGHTENPTYQEVKSQKSGHSETVKIDYDEAVISLKDILRYYYQIIDPVSVNKQGEDVGISYRTGIQRKKIYLLFRRFMMKFRSSIKNHWLLK